MITQLINSYEDLQLQYDRVVEQLESEKENRMVWQMQARESRKDLVQTKLANVRNLPGHPEVMSHWETQLTSCRSPTPSLL